MYSCLISYNHSPTEGFSVSFGHPQTKRGICCCSTFNLVFLRTLAKPQPTSTLNWTTQCVTDILRRSSHVTVQMRGSDTFLCYSECFSLYIHHPSKSSQCRSLLCGTGTSQEEKTNQFQIHNSAEKLATLSQKRRCTIIL